MEEEDDKPAEIDIEYADVAIDKKAQVKSAKVVETYKMHNDSSMGATVVRDSLGSLSGLTGNTQDKIVEPKPMESSESEVKTDELAH